MNTFLRIILFFPGLIFRFIELGKHGSRDLHNKIRFKNVKLEPETSINYKSKISEFVAVSDNCLINNGIIKSYTYIGRDSVIQNAEIGFFCSIANEVLIGLGAHPLHFISTSPLFYRINNPVKIKLIRENFEFEEYKKIVIGNDVWIGTRAIIMDGITIGNGAVIAANSVVTRDVPAYAVVGGVPAKIIKFRFNTNEILQLEQLKWWDKDFAWLRKNSKFMLDINNLEILSKIK